MSSVTEKTISDTTRYAAFISYSHRDRKVAQWLHRALETYRPPQDLVHDSREREPLRPIFLDRAELPSSSDLALSVRGALQASDFLIVVCSPAAAQSRWVNEEIRVFKSLGGEARILAFVIAGELRHQTFPGHDPQDCLPPALRYVVTTDGEVTSTLASEPLAADIRSGKDDPRHAMLKIAAGMLRVPLDRLVQRDNARRHSRMVQIAAAAGLGCLVFAGLAVFAVHSRNEAVRQRRVAVQQSLTAQRTAGFLKSLFAVSDPSEARGKSITAREVLDRGVQQINTQLKDEPGVRADLTTTLGEVYASLGLLHEGGDLLKDAQSIPALSPALAARQLAAVGDVQFQQGDLAAALDSFKRSRSVLSDSGVTDPALYIRIENGLGRVYQRQDDCKSARVVYAEALSAAAHQELQDPSPIIAAEEGIAQCDMDDQRYDAAEAGFQHALQRQIVSTGENHPRAAEILNELGSLEYLRGNRLAASNYFSRTLEIEQQVLGERHPDVTITMNNLARTLLEQRRFEEAGALLERSMAARTAQVTADDANMAFVYSNLALVRMGLKDYEAARPLFEKGLQNAIVNKHRLHGPILTDFADLDCRTGKYEEGLTFLDQGRPIVAARYPDDPWRLAHLDNVRAGCLTRMKRYAEAEPLIASSMPVLLPKWPAATLYGHDALERSMQLYRLTGDQQKLAQYRLLAQSTTPGVAR